jgi:hypothetical protein
MPFTREQQAQIKSHLFDQLFVETADGPIEKALKQNGFEYIHDIMTMNRDKIRVLKYSTTTDGDTVTTDLNGSQRGKITSLQDFVISRARTKGSALTADEYLALTRDMYDNFRTDPNYMPTAQTGSAPPTQSHLASSRDPVSDFKRGIKRDVSLFPKLKADKGWDGWKRTVVTQARMQDVSEVLDHTYVPANPSLAALFTEKQKFMYAVFDTVLLTDQGKAYVRQHTDTYDAQKVYKSLCDYSTKSTKATLDSTELLEYVTSAKLGDGTWRGSTHAFILNWQDQVRKYHDLVATNERFPDTIQRTMLKNAVHMIQDLRSVKSQAAQIQTSTGKAISYSDYSNLLVSSAVTYDKQFEPKGKRPAKGANRVV